MAGDMERSRNREMMKHAQEKPDKLSKAEKLDKLERLERMERSEKVGRLEAQMLSKIRAGVDTMVLGGKEMEYLMEGDIMVCREFTELYAVLHTILKKMQKVWQRSCHGTCTSWGCFYFVMVVNVLTWQQVVSG